MDAYVMGHLDGDLPRQLLEEGEPGNRIRALATLEGPAHDVYAAIEAPDEPALEKLVSKLVDVGFRVDFRLIRCLIHPCAQIVGTERLGPSWIPPFDHLLFEIFEADQAAEALDEASTTLGSGAVAAATDGEGRVLIQLGSNDRTQLSAASESLRARLGTSSGAHHVTGDGLLRK